MRRWSFASDPRDDEVEPAAIDRELQHDLERQLTEAGLTFQAEALTCDDYGSDWDYVVYIVDGASQGRLALGFELYPDQLYIRIGGCEMFLELAGFLPNPRARELWREHAARTVGQLLDSELRIETRWWRGKLVGGYCWRRDGERWILFGGGGSVFMFLCSKRTDEYSKPARQAAPPPAAPPPGIANPGEGDS